MKSMVTRCVCALFVLAVEPAAMAGVLTPSSLGNGGLPFPDQGALVITSGALFSNYGTPMLTVGSTVYAGQTFGGMDVYEFDSITISGGVVRGFGFPVVLLSKGDVLITGTGGIDFSNGGPGAGQGGGNGWPGALSTVTDAFQGSGGGGGGFGSPGQTGGVGNGGLPGAEYSFIGGAGGDTHWNILTDGITGGGFGGSGGGGAPGGGGGGGIEIASFTKISIGGAGILANGGNGSGGGQYGGGGGGSGGGILLAAPDFGNLFPLEANGGQGGGNGGAGGDGEIAVLYLDPPTPEPSSLVLAGVGAVLGLACARRRRKTTRSRHAA